MGVYQVEHPGTDEPAQNKLEVNMHYDTVIIVGDNAHAWIAKSATIDHETKMLTAVNARIIRRWGTDSGLNQLISGPTKETVIDAMAPRLDIAWHAVLYLVPADNAAWAKHLK